MACNRPVTAWKPLQGGALVFYEVKDCREVKIACGQCLGCRIAKQEMWAVRCYAESKCHAVSSFVTLTYDEDHFPQYGSLDYADFQRFMYRLRRRLGPTRFFMCGEYGEQLARPHFHALLFGRDFDDKYKCNSIYSRDTVYRSPVLESLWPFGFSTIGSVTYESARYCAAYVTKKVTGDLAEAHYSRVVPETGEIIQLTPEFARMSLKPGIGAVWLEKYWRDIYVSGANGIVVNGAVKRIPRYFNKVMEDLDGAVLESFMFDRELEAQKHALDNYGLMAREVNLHAKRAFNNSR